jgi:hypothetical protein
MPSKFVIHFYPGQKLLLVLKDGAEVERAEAWGGPDAVVRTGFVMDMGPTDAGRFILLDPKPYVTRTWAASRIRWGAKLKDIGTDVLYDSGQVGFRRWQSVLRKTGWTRQNVIDRYKELYGGPERVPSAWVFNDFGPLAVRYFKDKNRDGKLSDGEWPSGEMFHTTPDNEAEAAGRRAVSLVESHGCIHLKPADRDRLIRAGVFRAGTPLVIHKYSEKYVPKPSTSPSPASTR